LFNSKSHYKFDLKGGDKIEKAQLFWQTYLNLEKEYLDVAKYIYITDESISYSKNRLIKSHCKTQLETFLRIRRIVFFIFAKNACILL